MTTEAYIFEAIRTPRGRNKKGSLHSVNGKPIWRKRRRDMQRAA